MSDEPLLLGLDIGTTRMKALLVDRAGTRQGLVTGATPFVTRPEGVEMDAAALQRAVADLLARLGVDRRRVAAAGVAGMAESGTALDRAGRPLGPVIAWHDARGGDTIARLRQRFGDELAVRIGQRLRPVMSVAKLGWLCAHGEREVHRWLGVPELCLYWLTGAAATDYSLAARTGCYDVAGLDYLPEVAEAVGVSVDVFPTVRPAGAAMGTVSAPGAAWSGLPAGIPVTVAGHDHLAGAEAVGAGAGDLVNSVGTAETVLAVQPRLPNLDRALALRLAVSVRPAGHGWVVLAGAARAGLVLNAAADALGRSPSALDDLAETAGSVDAGGVLAYIDAVKQGEAPQLPDGEPGAVWNGLLEALAEQTAEAAQRLVRLLGPARRMVVFGGGGRSRQWLRAKARAVGLPVVRAAETEEAARGAALSAGVAAGWWATLDQAPGVALEPVD